MQLTPLEHAVQQQCAVSSDCEAAARVTINDLIDSMLLCFTAFVVVYISHIRITLDTVPQHSMRMT